MNRTRDDFRLMAAFCVDCGHRLERSLHRARIDGIESLSVEKIGEMLRLFVSLVRKVHVNPASTEDPVIARFDLSVTQKKKTGGGTHGRNQRVLGHGLILKGEELLDA